MAQSTDYVLDNQPPASLRAELNQILQAIVTGNSGPTPPTVTYPGMPWENTSTSPPTLNRRNLANSAWITDGLGETTNRGNISTTNPVLTGTVSIPTPVTTSNTTVAASTAFVVARLKVHDTAWISGTLVNAWSGTFFYRLNNNNTVSLRGVVTKTSSTGADVIGNLPAGFRPTLAEHNRYNAALAGTAGNRLTVGINGDITLNLGGATLTNPFVALDNITFPIS
jgi:hypothetical protein